MNRVDIIKAGIFGTVVGDALGVPVEFSSRGQRKEDPVKDMRAYGTHNQPKGTWSDDSSMMLATLDSIIQRGGIRYDDIMEKFRLWLLRGDYTPHGDVFDAGGTCTSAISKYRPGVDARECGGTNERSNGNGSLMRIMPVSLYVGFDEDFWKDSVLEDEVDKVQGVSSLTHAHPRSLMGCVIYTAICHELIYRNDKPLLFTVQYAVDKTLEFYANAWEAYSWFDDAFLTEIRAGKYDRLRDLTSFKDLPDTEIRGSGYVVDCLESSIWCLLNSESYADCVLKAVNLGEDTDTTAVVTGGLAGLYYGYDNIPKDWIDAIVSKEWIRNLCESFAHILDV